MEKRFLSCEVGKGMFQGEQIVSFKVGETNISSIVNTGFIKNGKLEVDVYDTKEDELLIGIPGESFSTTRKIWVPKEMIEEIVNDPERHRY